MLISSLLLALLLVLLALLLVLIILLLVLLVPLVPLVVLPFVLGIVPPAFLMAAGFLSLVTLRLKTATEGLQASHMHPKRRGGGRTAARSS
jgi:hypothetical protein